MRIEFIEGKHINESVKLCHKYLRDKYIREVLMPAQKKEEAPSEKEQ